MKQERIAIGGVSLRHGLCAQVTALTGPPSPAVSVLASELTYGSAADAGPPTTGPVPVISRINPTKSAETYGFGR